MKATEDSTTDKNKNCCGCRKDSDGEEDQEVDARNKDEAPEGDKVEALEEHLRMTYNTRQKAIKNWIKLGLTIQMI